MSIASVVSGGFGNGTFSGSIALVVLLGYSTQPVSEGDGTSAGGLLRVAPDNSINRVLADDSINRTILDGSINRVVSD